MDQNTIEDIVRKTLEQFKGYTDGCGCCSWNSIGEGTPVTISDEFVDEVVKKIQN